MKAKEISIPLGSEVACKVLIICEDGLSHQDELKIALNKLKLMIEVQKLDEVFQAN
ncbi:hypothetical protein [Brevibacillus porteri]|uniref:hypothetical protein n=1 Tax=Brevibacillus porteri TaxID=2126350 RepID=UPI00363BA6E6